MILLISEKPSVGQVIAKVLGVKSRRDGYMEGGDWLISWCIGHLVEPAPPDSYDPRSPKRGSIRSCRERRNSLTR